jgi:hypothetical protein
MVISRGMGMLQSSHGLVTDFSDHSGERTSVIVGGQLQRFAQRRL